MPSSVYLSLRDFERMILSLVSLEIPMLILEFFLSLALELLTENISMGDEINSLDLYWASRSLYLLMISRFSKIVFL